VSERVKNRKRVIWRERERESKNRKRVIRRERERIIRRK
jgi:hypothetical protein